MEGLNEQTHHELCAPPLCCCPTAGPVKVCLNQIPEPSWTNVSSRFDGRYRISPTNWDSAIFLGSTLFAQAPSPAIGNLTQLNGQAFAFEASYAPGTADTDGYTWSLQGLGANPGPFSLVFWNINGTINNRNASLPFNAIQVLATASTAVGNALRVRDLSFQVYGVPTVVCGVLIDMNQTYTGSTTSVSQWLIADTDLSKLAWSLSGVVTGVRAASGNDEQIKLDVYTKNISPTPTITTCGGSSCPVS